MTVLPMTVLSMTRKKVWASNRFLSWKLDQKVLPLLVLSVTEAVHTMVLALAMVRVLTGAARVLTALTATRRRGRWSASSTSEAK